MKPTKKTDLIDKAEILDDPGKKYQQIAKINEEMDHILETETNLKILFEQIESNLSRDTVHDKDISKSDTVDCIKIYFDRIIKELAIFKQLSSTVREKLYFIIYNISILFYDYCHRMRKYSYSIHGVRYLVWIITVIESNIVLSGIKYLKWRVKLYSELAGLYEDYGGFKSAYRVISLAITKLNEQKAIEDQQGPLPEHIRNVFIENFRILKYFEFKYGMLSGNLQLDQWKKKLEETYTDEKEKFSKYICAMNSISSPAKFCSIVNHDGMKIPWKSQALAYIYDQIKNDIANIKAGVVEYIEKKKRYLEMDVKIQENAKAGIKDYQNILDETLQKNQAMNKAWRQSVKAIPIEIHIEVLKGCYDCKMWKEFTELLEALMVRIKYRRIEVPYLSEVDVQMSSIQFANVPNKYERIQIDLNVNNYKREIRGLREKGKCISAVNKNEGGGKNQKEAKETKNNPGKKKIIEETVENPYEKIDGLDHSFTYLMVRRTHNPKKAIINCRIVMSTDNKIKSLLEEGERAVAIPIRTFKDNLYEEEEKMSEVTDITVKLLNEYSKLTPYLVIKKTLTGLQNQEEKLIALTDLFPLISNWPFAEAPMNFKKIDSEISIPGKVNDPKYMEYNFNHNYVNLCYKTDEMFHIIERECGILKDLYELEQSYVEKATEESDMFLMVNYSMEKLDILATGLYNSIQAPLGKFFLGERRNFLYDISILLWNKYLKDALMRIDYFFLIESELEEDKRGAIFTKILNYQKIIFNVLYSIHAVLSQFKRKDPIIYAFLASRLSDFSERTSNEHIGVEILQKTLDYLNYTRECENIFGMSNDDNKHTFTSFTCDNNKISKLVQTINGKFEDHVRMLNFKRRQNYRTVYNLNKLTTEEQKEEDFETTSLEKEYKDRLEKMNKIIYTGANNEHPEKGKINYHVTENENIINCIYVDLQMKFFRLYLKCGDDAIHTLRERRKSIERDDEVGISSVNDNNSTVTVNNGNQSMARSKSLSRQVSAGAGPGDISALSQAKISKHTLKKLDIIHGASASQVKDKMETLKHSLQEAGKLEPDKPVLSKSEKHMLQMISRNPYISSLFQASMAQLRPNKKQDQKYLLNVSVNYLSKCFAEEDLRCNYYIENFFYIKSIERFNRNKNINASSFYPYNLLSKPIMIEACDKLPEPILVNKTQSTASFIFPIVKIKNDILDKVYRSIKKVAIFGQQSTGTNIVQLHNKSLTGTNNITHVMNYVTVRNLKQNEKYIFAYAGYDNDDVIINGIGSTSKEVEAYFPLPLFYLSYHICKIAYEFKHYEVCKEKSKIVFNNFTEKSELKELSLDNKTDCLFFYKLKFNYIANTSFIELEGVSFCFYFFAKCMSILKKSDHSDDTGNNIYPRQKNILKNLNVMMLGLEIATYIRHFQLIKLYVQEIYTITSTGYSFLKQKKLYRHLIQIFIRMNMAINIIPNEIWDLTLRKLSSLVSYQILVMLVNINECEIYKKLLVQELGLSKKRFYAFPYIYLKKAEEEKRKGGAPEKKIGKEKLPAKEEEEQKMIEAEGSVIKDLEKETIELDEFLLSFGEFNDIVRTRISQYLNYLDNAFGKNNPNSSQSLSKYKEILPEIEKKKKEISEFVEIWDGFQFEGVKFCQKYVTTSKDNDKYYETCSKLLKRLIENFTSSISGVNLAGITSLQVSDKKQPLKEKDNPFAQLPDILKLSEDIAIKDSDMGFILNKFNQKLSFLSNDIIYTMKRRIKEFLDKVEKEMPKASLSASSAENSKSISPHSGDTISPSSVSESSINLEKIRMQIEEKYFGSLVEEEIVSPYSMMSNINDIYSTKEKIFWIGDLLFNKALLSFVEYLTLSPSHQPLLNYEFNNFLNYRLVDFKKLQLFSAQDEVKLLDCRNGMGTAPVVNSPRIEKPAEGKQNEKKEKSEKMIKEANIDTIMSSTRTEFIEKSFDTRHKKLTKLFEKLAFASLFMEDVNNNRELDNLIYVAYNLLVYDMLSPFDSVKDNLWCYLNILSENAIARLEKIRTGDEIFTETDYILELNNIKHRICEVKHLNRPLNFCTMKKYSTESINKLEDENLIDVYEKKINLDVYIEFICFTIQCTYYIGKWNILSNLIQKFNIVTNHKFNEFTLAFLIEAQKNIYEKAHENTKNKQVEINHRAATYETWKNTRKKNKRQQLITGEIPVEQQEFERDYSIMTKELFILESISNLLREDKEKSEGLHQAIVNDTNSAKKAVMSCRRKFEEYQVEAMYMNRYMFSFGINYKEYQSKSKGIKFFASSLINTYKNCIIMLKKRQENFLIVQMLYEMSIIYYSENDIKNSEIYFNEALDTVFQKLYILKDFRTLLQLGPNITEKYGLGSLFYGISILHKLAKFCYDTDCYNQRECALMAADVVYNILNNCIPNPSNILAYGTYRLLEINKNFYVFKSCDNVKPNDLLTSLLDLADILMSYCNFELALPMLCLAEYISCDICKNINHLLKVRISKAICLAEIGMISESMQVYYQIIKKFDLPSFLGFGINEKYVGKSASLLKDFRFLNHLPPDHQKNLDAATIFSKLTIDNDLKTMLGPNLFYELIYTKSIILFKIFEKENYSAYPEKNPYNDARMDVYMRLEKELRDTLIYLNATEEISTLSYLIKEIKFLDLSPKYIDVVKQKLDELCLKNKITSEEMNTFYLLKFNKNETDLRKERMDLMSRIRILLSRMYSSQGLVMASSGVLLKGTDNLRKYTSGALFNVEIGDDYIFDYKPSEITLQKVGSKPADLKRSVEKEKDQKKVSAVPIGVNIDDEIYKILTEVSTTRNGRTYPNSNYWLRLQYLNLTNLFKMSRYEDCLMLIKKFEEYSVKLNDTFYYIRAKEIEAMIQSQNYDIAQAENALSCIKNRGNSNFIDDIELAIFYANYSEFLYTPKKRDEALSMLRSSRKMIWEKMAKFNYIIHSQSITSPNLISCLDIDKNLKQILKDRETMYIPQGQSKKLAELIPKGGKKDDKSGEISQIPFNQTVFTSSSEVQFEKPSKEINESNEGANLYFKYTDLLCKIDMKFAYLEMMNSNIQNLNVDIMSNVLADLEILCSKQIFPHATYKIVIAYLNARILKFRFFSDLRDFLNEKFYSNVALLKKNNIEIVTINKDILIKFSNSYNERCLSVWIGLLLKSRELLEKALYLSKSEFYLFENTFSVVQVLTELADINFLIAEYRPNLTPKYCDVMQVVNKISSLMKTQTFYDSENDDLPYIPNESALPEDIRTEKAQWSNERLKADILSTKTALRNVIYYTESAIKINGIKKLLNENIYELASAALVDPSKLPRDISAQILECDYITKKKKKNVLTNTQPKPVCDAFDVYNLFKNYMKEMEYFTFVNMDEQVKNVSKLHKFLKANSSHYSTRCFTEISTIAQDITDVTAEIAKKDMIIVNWILNPNEVLNHSTLDGNSITSDTVNMLYLLCPNSAMVELKDVAYGRVSLSRSFIMSLDQRIYDMKIKLRQSLALSEQKKKRDVKYFQRDYYNMILELAKEMLKGKKMYSEMKAVEEQIKKEMIGEVSVEALDFWYNMLNFQTYSAVSQKFNALLYEMHLKLLK